MLRAQPGGAQTRVAGGAAPTCVVLMEGLLERAAALHERAAAGDEPQLPSFNEQLQVRTCVATACLRR